MVTKESIIDNLYSICQDRTLHTKEVVSKLIENSKVTVVPSALDLEKLEEIVRPYKRTGKNLEYTVNEIYSILDKLSPISTWNYSSEL